jgi:hypothetical protein
MTTQLTPRALRCLLYGIACAAALVASENSHAAFSFVSQEREITAEVELEGRRTASAPGFSVFSNEVSVIGSQSAAAGQISSLTALELTFSSTLFTSGMIARDLGRSPPAAAVPSA